MVRANSFFCSLATKNAFDQMKWEFTCVVSENFNGGWDGIYKIYMFIIGLTTYHGDYQLFDFFDCFSVNQGQTALASDDWPLSTICS